MSHHYSTRPAFRVTYVDVRTGGADCRTTFTNFCHDSSGGRFWVCAGAGGVLGEERRHRVPLMHSWLTTDRSRASHKVWPQIQSG